MTFSIAHSDGKFTLGELGTPPKVFQQVSKGGKGGYSNIGHGRFFRSIHYLATQMTRKAVFDKSLFDTVAITHVEAPMYRIVKRIVHTITTVTWLIRLEDNSMEEKYVEKEITFPASQSVTEEEISKTNHLPKQITESSQSTLDSERRAKQRQSPTRDKGEIS
jgi:hypothetical protein